ncbi:MAG TPA: D-alanine--D-alanine ligase family protein [Chroococcales cyanobacterium]
MRNGDNRRQTVAIMFGGRSVEHEISIITGLQLIKALDVVKYAPLPLYIAPSGKWYAGDALLDRQFYRNMPASFDLVDEVTLLPQPGVNGLTVVRPKAKSRADSGYSLQSENRVIPVDVFFVSFHGTFGEDGCIQGLLELAEVPYTGCGVLSAAVGMSKYHCKKLLESHGIPVLPSAMVYREEIEEGLGRNLAAVRERVMNTESLDHFPLFVKPGNLGSSIGISKADDEAQLDAALMKVFKYDYCAIIEPCLDNKLEMNVSVLEDLEPQASVVEIPVSSSDQGLSYEDKYMRGGGGKKTGPASQGMASLTRVIDPIDLSPQIKETARDYAVRAFKALGCAGVARIDFMLDLQKNVLYFNEINTLPGSLAFYLWMNSHPPVLYTDMLTKMIVRAQGRHDRKLSLHREIGFKALFK